MLINLVTIVVIRLFDWGDSSSVPHMSRFELIDRIVSPVPCSISVIIALRSVVNLRQFIRKCSGDSSTFEVQL